jgi:nucleoside-diphosphate-sugar epimerase
LNSAVHILGPGLQHQQGTEHEHPREHVHPRAVVLCNILQKTDKVWTRKSGEVPYGVDRRDACCSGAATQERTTPIPQSSYGIQKLIGELLVSEYSRKGFIDGRTVRLPTVSIRPGKPNAAASSFASGILREPLNGVEAICPVEPDTKLWLISPRLAVECLLHGFDLPAGELGRIRSVSLPGITVSVDEMVASLKRVAGPEAARRIRWEPDEGIRQIVKSWPARFDTARADSLGFPRDKGGFDRIIDDYIRDEGLKLQPKY